VNLALHFTFDNWALDDFFFSSSTICHLIVLLSFYEISFGIIGFSDGTASAQHCGSRLVDAERAKRGKGVYIHV